MQTLPTLVKLAKHSVDEQQRVVAELQAVADNLAAHLRHLHAEHDALDQLAIDELHLLQQRSRYAVRLRAEIKTFMQKQTELHQHLEAARDELSRRFADQKRYELLAEAERTKAAQVRAKKQQAQLDDIANQRRSQPRL